MLLGRVLLSGWKKLLDWTLISAVPEETKASTLTAAQNLPASSAVSALTHGCGGLTAEAHPGLPGTTLQDLLPAALRNN